jgi:lysylphosphatidylglycerol synthetase-like protein (DUF2156 family)
MKSKFIPPLSWTTCAAGKSVFQVVELPSSNTNWLSVADLQPTLDTKTFISHLSEFTNQNIIVRGCPEILSSELRDYGFKRYLMSKEAVLDLTAAHFRKSSLKDLVRRGNRHGNIREIPYNEQNAKKLKTLYRDSRYGKTPRLRYLYRDDFHEKLRCFAFEANDGHWLGALTISNATPQKIHTEILMRVSDAPVGIMEALIFRIFIILKNESYHYWSLGEVPFITDTSEFSKIKEHIINKIGKLFVFSYNFKGLYRFKNKFNPKWENIYICGRPELTFLSLTEMAYKCNYVKLLIRSFLRKMLRG